MDPRKRHRKAESPPIPPEKGVVEKKGSRGKIPKVINGVNYGRKSIKEARTWLL